MSIPFDRMKTLGQTILSAKMYNTIGRSSK